MSSTITGSSQNPTTADKSCVNYGTYNRRSHARSAAAAAACVDDEEDDRSSELSDSGHFLAKGAFLITPSNELNLEKATAICEKMNYRGPYSVTRTATGILFKFADQDDYHVTYRKGFHKVTNSRFYKKVSATARTCVTLALTRSSECTTDISRSVLTFNPLNLKCNVEKEEKRKRI